MKRAPVILGRKLGVKCDKATAIELRFDGTGITVSRSGKVLTDDTKLLMLRNIRDFARRLHVDMHGRGEPVEARRRELKASIRRDILLAMRALRQARTAVLAGNNHLAELYFDRARMHHLLTVLRLKNPYAIRAGTQALDRPRRGLLGAAATAGNAAQRNAKLDSLIAACLARGEATRSYVKAWAAECGVSRQTVYTRIRKVKAETSK